MKYIAKLKVDNDILLHGDGCITTLHELYKVLIDKQTNEIEISKEFAEHFFTYQGLCDFVEQATFVAPNVRIAVPDYLVDNTLSVVKDLQYYRNPDDFIYALEQNPNRIISTVQELCKSYMSVHEEAAIANAKLSSMLVQIDELERKLSYSKMDYGELVKTKNDMESKLHVLVNRMNYSYDKTVNPDELFVIKHNSYKHILYLKEITRVHFTDTLVYYLQQILRTLYGMPVRSVVIEPYYAYGSASRYPGYKTHWNLSYRDVYSGDILMAGFQPKLMTDIMYNPNHVNYLILLDRGGYSVPHLDCPNVSVVHLASDVKDLPENYELAITYDTKTETIPFVEDFANLSPEKKLQIYSSMDVTKKLINVLEEVN